MVGGHNHYNQLVIDDQIHRNKLVQVVGFKAQSVVCWDFHIVLGDLDNNVWVVGKNDRGHLGLGDNLDRSISHQWGI